MVRGFSPDRIAGVRAEVNNGRITLVPILLWSACSVLAQAQGPGWTLGPFVRPVTGPIIEPNPKSIFTDPITNKPVRWEALHTFNPAAIVRMGKVYVFYRAEDDSGTMVIGMHTSRLGLASSEDGIHFTTEPTPVFYPDEDSQKTENGREGSKIPGWLNAKTVPMFWPTRSGIVVLRISESQPRLISFTGQSRDPLWWARNTTISITNQPAS
jgi:hypothetical protein